MRRSWVGIICGVVLVGSMWAAGQTTKPKAHDPAMWEKDIAAFEKEDAEKKPEAGGVVFVGSSAVRLWELDKSFPGLHALNRGFGGSFASDAVHYEDRIVTKYRPRIVVLLAGENDLNHGENVKSVEGSIEQFEKKLHEADKRTKLIIMGFKPTTARWKLWPQEQEINSWLGTFVKDHANTEWVDVSGVMLKDGKPNPKMLRKDGIHPSDEGYAAWKKLLEPHLNDAK